MESGSEQSVRATMATSVLSGPLGEPTEWFVVTGPPSAGKTTLLNLLANRGFSTSPDVSRQVLTAKLATSGEKHSIRQNEELLQRQILREMLISEAELPRDRRVFLDYALPDNLAFWELGNLQLSGDVWRAAVRFRYKHVFLLEPLPFKEDEIRTETAEYQARLTFKLGEYYRALGYAVTAVPALPRRERLSLLLRRLETL